jgi:hypothetical protein
MAMKIVNCPSCGTFLLDDTAECHSCGHVLNSKMAAKTKHQALPTDQAVDEDMESCSNCGEPCRKGLVRCWNCGAFTRAEIAALYMQRRDSGSTEPVQPFDLPVIESTSIDQSDSSQRRKFATPESFLEAPPVAREESDGGDDFELSEEVQMSEVDEDAFDLSEEIQLRTSGADDLESPGSTYSLTPIAEPPAAPPPAQADGDMETIPLMPTMTDASGEQDAPAGIPSLDPSAAGETMAGGAPTGGDAPAAPAAPSASPEDELLKIAAEEEAEISQVRKGQRNKDTFVVYCPQGHRIRVRERFRGKTGKCPQCESVFIVPAKQQPRPKKRTDVEISAVGGEANANVGRYAKWMSDVRLHTVIPEKLKIKADSLTNDFQAVDVGIGKDDILIATLVAASGLFGGAAKKKPAVRLAMLEYFTKPDAQPDGAVVASKRVIGKDAFSQFVLAQPVPIGTESLFGNIPIFGAGRIAVRLPRAADDKNTQYLSFSLSEFRDFAESLRGVCGIEGFGSNAEIPLTDQYETHKCHYNSTPVLNLQQLEFYQKDPSFKVEVSGWKCGTCGIVIGEEARKKEKLGGANGKAIAKAKCPKCGQKLGSNPLLKLVDAAPATTPAPPTPAEPDAATAAPPA